MPCINYLKKNGPSPNMDCTDILGKKTYIKIATQRKLDTTTIPYPPRPADRANILCRGVLKESYKEWVNLNKIDYLYGKDTITVIADNRMETR